MRLTTIKSHVAIAVAAFGIAAVAAPKVTIDKIGNGSVWSTKKVTYTVSDVPTANPDVSYELAFDVTAYSVTTNIKMGVAQNGTFTYTLDTAAIFGETRKDPQAKFRVSLEAKWDLEPVQLWANGPCFAKCNIGANAPHEAGYYFWWGDKVGYVRNSSNNGWVSSQDGTTSMRFANNLPDIIKTYEKTIPQLKSEGFIEDESNPVLKMDYDAARAQLGGSWRMPTKAELDALIENCTMSWVTNWNNTGVNGVIIAGKDDFASKSIFLPATGFGLGDDLEYSTMSYCWASTANDDHVDSHCFNYPSKFPVNREGRFYGIPVRAVK